MQVTLVTRLADVAMLLAMAALPPQGSMIGFLIALHLMRMATANCTRCVPVFPPQTVDSMGGPVPCNIHCLKVTGLWCTVISVCKHACMEIHGRVSLAQQPMLAHTAGTWQG